MRKLAVSTAAPSPSRSTSPGLIWLALGSIYIVWGSTYLAIRYSIETIPPFLSASIRFLVAGAILYTWSSFQGDLVFERPGWRQWRAATIVGGALLLGGNGGVVWAEQHIPSGIAALVVATVPLWMAVMDRAIFGQRLSWTAILGLALGFSGLTLLFGGHGTGRIDPVGVGVVVFASFSWAAGSLYSRRAPLPTRPLVGTGMEMIAGGALLGIVGLATGEAADLHLTAISLRSWLGLGYLIVFGSLVGFTAYVWLLRVARTSLVSTYAYVNPVIAVLLGWALVSEPLTARTLIAGAVIVVAVILIVTARQVPAAGEPAEGSSVPEGSEERGRRAESQVLLESMGGAEDRRLAEDGTGELKAHG
jgi:drug/metabolite transporter (DMT)-like permease